MRRVTARVFTRFPNGHGCVFEGSCHKCLPLTYVAVDLEDKSQGFLGLLFHFSYTATNLLSKICRQAYINENTRDTVKVRLPEIRQGRYGLKQDDLNSLSLDALPDRFSS